MKKAIRVCCLLHTVFLLGVLFYHEVEYFIPKRQLSFTGLHGVISQKIKLFIAIAVDLKCYVTGIRSMTSDMKHADRLDIPASVHFIRLAHRKSPMYRENGIRERGKTWGTPPRPRDSGGELLQLHRAN
jgi:hypothetical protein